MAACSPGSSKAPLRSELSSLRDTVQWECHPDTPAAVCMERLPTINSTHSSALCIDKKKIKKIEAVTFHPYLLHRS